MTRTMVRAVEERLSSQARGARRAYAPIAASAVNLATHRSRSTQS